MSRRRPSWDERAVRRARVDVDVEGVCSTHCPLARRPDEGTPRTPAAAAAGVAHVAARQPQAGDGGTGDAQLLCGRDGLVELVELHHVAGRRDNRSEVGTEGASPGSPSGVGTVSSQPST